MRFALNPIDRSVATMVNRRGNRHRKSSSASDAPPTPTSDRGRASTPSSPTSPTMFVPEPPTALVADPPTAVVAEPPTAVVVEPPTALVPEPPIAVAKVVEVATALDSTSPAASDSEPEPPGALDSEASVALDSTPPTTLDAESNLRATSTSAVDAPSSASAPPELKQEEEEGTTAADNAPPPPLTIKRSQALGSSASLSSCCSSSSSSVSAAIPRSRSLILTDNAAVLQAMPTSKVEAVEVMAEQSWLITKLTVQLLWALRMSRKWIWMALRLVAFVVFLLPALLRMVYYWALDTHVHKNIIYGLNGRNLLDVYTVPSDQIVKPSTLRPQKHQTQKDQDNETPNKKNRPVVVFLTGGAWIIGYKAWGTLLGRALSVMGIVVVMPDYRNFPQGILPEMVDDTTMAMQWVFDNVHHFGGDPENVTLIGQSAGAHIAMCALLEQVEKRKQWLEMFNGQPQAQSIPDGASATMAISSPSSYSTHSGAASSVAAFEPTSLTQTPVLPHAPTWELRQIRSVIGISGPYNIEDSIETFHRHGFDRNVVERIMDHRISYFSPALRFFSYSENARAHALLHDFPPVYLFHGTADTTVTWRSTDQLAQALQSCGLRVQAEMFADKTHTDIIIEDPISGRDDVLLDRIVAIIKAQSPADATPLDAKAVATPPKLYYPAPLVKMARFVNPF